MTLEEEIIIAHLIKKDRVWVKAHADFEFTHEQQKNYSKMIELLKSGCPLPYILGYKEFYGRNFFVNKHTLIPRHETELIIDLVKECAQKNKNLNIFDIGTGSGCIAITLNLEIPQAKVSASDISKSALEIAQKNANTLKARVSFMEGNLLLPFLPLPKGKKIIITANLPYIPTGKYNELEKSIRDFEPKDALKGGEDGLDYYRELIGQIPKEKKLTLFLEADPEQMANIESMIIAKFPQAHIGLHNDLSQKARVLEVNICQAAPCMHRRTPMPSIGA